MDEQTRSQFPNGHGDTSCPKVIGFLDFRGNCGIVIVALEFAFFWSITFLNFTARCVEGGSRMNLG